MATAPRLLTALLLAVTLAPQVASACAIDNIASLSANGVRATLTGTAPAGKGLWAPFTFTKAFASATPVQVSESRADLARTLSPAELAAPYRWAFGDGATALGHVVSHRYAHPGTYRLEVYAYSRSTRRWFSFDQALLQIVPPGQVLQANLGYYLLRALDILMSSVMWLVDAALLLLVLLVVRSRLRVRRTRLPS